MNDECTWHHIGCWNLPVWEPAKPTQLALLSRWGGYKIVVRELDWGCRWWPTRPTIRRRGQRRSLKLKPVFATGDTEREAVRKAIRLLHLQFIGAADERAFTLQFKAEVERRYAA